MKYPLGLLSQTLSNTKGDMSHLNISCIKESVQSSNSDEFGNKRHSCKGGAHILESSYFVNLVRNLGEKVTQKGPKAAPLDQLCPIGVGPPPEAQHSKPPFYA